MEILQADDSIGNAAKEAEWLHSIIDITDSPLGTTPHEESTDVIHFCIPDRLAKSTSQNNYDKYYAPRVVSIGPHHYGQPRLAAMENFKRIAVRELLSKSKISIEEVYASVEQDLLRIAKERYDVSNWTYISDRDWCHMMFLDGSFVIEFTSNNKNDRDLVWRDLLLLENQLPSQVLEKLASAFRCKFPSSLEFLNLRFLPMPVFVILSGPKFSSYSVEGHNLRRLVRDQNASVPVHRLQYYREMWIGFLFMKEMKKNSRRRRRRRRRRRSQEGGEEEEKEGLNKKEEDRLRTVTELKKVGIRCSCAMDHRTTFSPKSSIHFKSSTLSGKLFLPQLIIDEWTMTLFYNLVAYENLCLQNRSFEISSYFSFMSMIINGEEDVKELRARGLIQLDFNVDDDQVINFLRDITAHYEPNPQDFKDVKRWISTYFKSKRLPLRVAYAEFKQRYFSGPWSFLVFLAVIFTVGMTVIQTVLTGIQTYK